MRFNTLGRSGVTVSNLCLGAMMFGKDGNPDHEDCVRIVHAALDAGVNFIDTADVYSEGDSAEGDSEALVGQALANLARRARHQPGIASVIVGAKTKEQLADNVAATDLRLAAAELQSLDAASQLPPEYPGWMFDRQNRDRFPGGAIR